MRRWALGALGVAAYGAFLVAMTPAAFVAARVEKETRGALRLLEPTGTAWSGEARGTLVVPAGGSVVLDRVQWRLRPASLAAGRLGFSVQVDEPQLKAEGELARTFGDWQVRGARLEAPGAYLGALVPLASAWRPEGTIAADIAMFRWTPAALHGDARLEWRAAALGLSAVKPLGSYRAEIHGEGAQARVTLATLDGPLKISGNGTLSAAGRLRFAGEARAEGPQAGALQPLLDLLGPKRPDGSREIAIR